MYRTVQGSSGRSRTVQGSYRGQNVGSVGSSCRFTVQKPVTPQLYMLLELHLTFDSQNLYLYHQTIHINISYHKTIIQFLLPADMGSMEVGIFPWDENSGLYVLARKQFKCRLSIDDCMACGGVGVSA